MTKKLKIPLLEYINNDSIFFEINDCGIYIIFFTPIHSIILQENFTIDIIDLETNAKLSIKYLQPRYLMLNKFRRALGLFTVQFKKAGKYEMQIRNYYNSKFYRSSLPFFRIILGEYDSSDIKVGLRKNII